MDKAFESYKRIIIECLKNKHKLNDEEINNLITLYNLEELVEKNSDYFYYESPEYWADYLIS